jgi:F-type H+-transporting ATPase subunit epsilon
VAATFPLDIVTPERTVLSEDVISLQLPAVSGSMGVLAGHAPLLAELGVGECVVKMPTGAEEQLVLSGGFVEISREKVTILADTAEFAGEIDVNRAEAALARARDMVMSVESAGGGDREEANAALRRAQARLRVARGGPAK